MLIEQNVSGDAACTISLTRVEPDLWKATSSDGKFEVTAPTEERAAYDIQQQMLDAGIRGEL